MMRGRSQCGVVRANKVYVLALTGLLAPRLVPAEFIAPHVEFTILPPGTVHRELPQQSGTLFRSQFPPPLLPLERNRLPSLIACFLVKSALRGRGSYRII
eukprot:1329205-Amorphochlora_amoeboformis.AAC.2